MATATPLSIWSKNVETLPENYVMSPKSRPGKYVAVSKDIPVIDIGQASGPGRADLVQQVLKACQEFGLFQVVNHGVSETTMQDTMSLYKEFFNMSDEDKLGYCSDDPTKICRLYTSGLNFAQEDTHYWKDTFKHPCHPLEKYTPHFPEKPAKYRETVGRYTTELRKMGLTILGLISEGIGLNEDGFEGKLTEKQGMAINHYPACPNPSLAMGIPGHFDPNLMTILQQEVYGLQLLKDGQWLGIEPMPNAFVINLGYLMKVVSNGKLNGAEHRAITNVSVARTSIGTFFGPLDPSVIEPAKELVTATNPQLFKPFVYKEYLDNYRGGKPIEKYQLQA